MAVSTIKGNSPNFGAELTIPYGTNWVAPSDGFVRITTNPNTSGVTVVSVNGVLLYQDSNPYSFYKVAALFVRSGSTIYLSNTGSGGQSSVDGRFEPYN